jgi:hypothetical protein
MAEQELRARITADDRNFQQKTKRAEGRGKRFAKQMQQIGTMIAGAFVFTKAFQSIKKLITGITQMADKLLDLESQTGISTQRLQEFQYVAKIAGVNTDVVSNAAKNLTRRFQQLHSDSSAVSRAFQQLGVATKDSNGNMRDTGIIMEELLTKLAGMENQTERNKLGAQLFSNAWEDLAPILSLGAEGIDKAIDELNEMNGVMSEEAIDTANQLRMDLVKLNEQWAVMKRNIGSSLIPVISDFLGWLQNLDAQSLSLKNAIRSLGEGVINLVKKPFEKTKKEAIDFNDTLQDTQKIFEGLQDQTEDNTEKTESQSDAFKLGVSSIERHQEKLKELEERLKKLSPQQEDRIQDILLEKKAIEELLLSLNKLQKERSEISQDKASTPPRFSPAKGQINIETQTSTAGLVEMSSAIDDLTGKYIKAIDAQQRLIEKTKEQIEPMKRAEDAAYMFGKQVQYSAQMGIDSMEDYAKAVGNAARQAIAAYLAETVAAAVRNAIGTGFGGLILAPVLAGAAAVTFNALVPEFEQGGAVTGPTLAMIGEGAGVNKSNPEYVGTADQIAKMGINGSGLRLVTVDVHGEYLKMVLEETNRKYE